MKFLSLLFIVSIFSAGLSYAAETAPLELKDNQTVIQVKGVVCSFCAFGTEKNLSKLSFLDKSQYGGDGVLLDINIHRITLALDNSKTVDYPAINNAIVKGGYDPVVYFARVHGKASHVSGKTLLTCTKSGQVYELKGQDLTAFSKTSAVYVEGQITVESVTTLTEDQPVTLVVSHIEG
jgi:hypothetical protein